jgi:heat shock protein HslJ
MYGKWLTVFSIFISILKPKKVFKIILQASIAALIFTACSTNKSATTTAKQDTNMKANLIDGTWEANYIMNTPKPFTEIYSKAKPSISFNSADEKVMGLTGCNNFNGSFTLDDNKINISNALALTRKICADMTGEQTVLETLKKVNSYSITDQGKTLNLIMGDIAVMRLERK